MSASKKAPEPLLDHSRQLLERWRADTFSELRKYGVTGRSLVDIRVQISKKIDEALSTKRGTTDGALYALGEVLDSIERTSQHLESGRLGAALCASLQLVLDAHALRGHMILKEYTEQRSIGGKLHGGARTTANKDRDKNIGERYQSGERVKQIARVQGISRTTVYNVLKEGNIKPNRRNVKRN